MSLATVADAASHDDFNWFLGGAVLLYRWRNEDIIQARGLWFTIAAMACTALGHIIPALDLVGQGEYLLLLPSLLEPL